MGRGRAKAKQTKVARKLKYSTGNTDFAQLAEELGATSGSPVDGPTVDGSTERQDGTADEDDDLVERYADYADESNSPRR